MFSKVFTGALLGGLIMFIWSAFAHIVLPLGKMGISEFPDEEPLLESLKHYTPNSGMYFFPKMPEGMSEEQWAEKIRKGPSGMMVIHPEGSEPMMAGQFIMEFLSDVAAAGITAFILFLAVSRLSTFWSRVLFVTLIGLLPFIVVDFSYWNWESFPGAFVLAQLADQIGGFFLAGLILAWMIRPVQNVKSYS